MNIFVVEDEYTYYLRLYILGHEHIIYIYISLVMKLFVVWKMNTHIIYVYIS